MKWGVAEFVVGIVVGIVAGLLRDCCARFYRHTSCILWEENIFGLTIYNDESFIVTFSLQKVFWLDVGDTAGAEVAFWWVDAMARVIEN